MKKHKLQITVAPSAGFCPGVKKAVDTAYQEARDYQGKGRLFMYGDLVHNSQVIEDLTQVGFSVLSDPEQLSDKQQDLVLVRAHGVTEEEEAQLQSRAGCLVDCTCVWVKRVQDLASRARAEGKGFILCGDCDHPEVRGIMSRAGEPPW